MLVLSCRVWQNFAACIVLASGATAASADSIITMTGDFNSVYSDAYAFDGTNFTTLPGLFDGLAGGTFSVTYFVPTVIPPTNPAYNYASYPFSAPYGMTFTLYDKNGVAVTQGTGDTTYASADVGNNLPTSRLGDPNPSGSTDEVELSGYPGQLTGLQTPSALYGTPDFFIGYSYALFLNTTDLPTLPDNVTDLNLPTDAATYLSFPNPSFSTGAFWGSGDYNDQINPFQYDDSSIRYNIRGVTVMAVPEPGSVALLVGMGVAGAGFLARRRKRK